jgi:hypothetical protein
MCLFFCSSKKGYKNKSKGVVGGVFPKKALQRYILLFYLSIFYLYKDLRRFLGVALFVALGFL